MRLKDGIIIDKMGDEYVAVAAGEASKSFSGLIKLNRTAYFIVNQLKQDMTKEELVSAVLQHYEVDSETAAAETEKVIKVLKSTGVLE